MHLRKFTDIPATQLHGKRVFIRADLNVPQDADSNITDDTRIRGALAGVRIALDAGARVMLTSHLGRPIEGRLLPHESLAPIARCLSQHLERPVRLVTDWVGGEFEVAPGELVVLENCRGNVGETNNDGTLAMAMANLRDVYVNDAFGTAHRAEASTEGIARHATLACAGPLMTAEVEALHATLANPRRPLVAIVGGVKVSSKLGILEALADKVDQLIVGGGIANTFLLAQGTAIGKSLAEPGLVDQAGRIIAKLEARGASAPLPSDVVCAKTVAPASHATIKQCSDVADDDLILDVGPESALALARMLQTAGTVIWNGPVGVFEITAFSRGTRVLAMAIAESSAYALAGGGDTVAAINAFGIADRLDYISTGGGAFLEFLEGRPLPAIQALEDRAWI